MKHNLIIVFLLSRPSHTVTTSIEVTAIRFNDRRRIASAYFLYFCALGLYVPYFSAYLRARGLSGTQIGVLLALGPLMRTLMPPLWGLAADRVRGPRFWGLVAAWGAVVGLAALHGATDQATMLAASLLYYAFTAPMIPLLDASALAHLAESRGSFGQLRLWGSLGFIVTSFGLGQLAPALPGETILITLWGAHLLYAAAATAWPVQEAAMAKATWTGWGPLLRLPGFGWLLAALFLNRLAAAPYNGFYTLFIQAMGQGGDVVAWTWGIGVAVEVFVMMVVDRWIDRFGSTRVLAAGLFVEALRWFAYTAVTSRGALLLIAPLHGFAFTLLYVASVRRVGEIVPPEWRATGQGLAAAATGLGQMAGFVIAGWLYETAGHREMFLWGGFTGILAAFVALRRPRVKHMSG